VGAGPLPGLGPDHPPRPPIPIVALDEGAMAAARARGTDDALAVWLAGVTGSEHPAVHARTVASGALLPKRDPTVEPALTVEEVARAVDEGRRLAAAAAAAGASILVGARPVPGEPLASGAPDPDGGLPALCLTAALTGHPSSSLTDDPAAAAACERALAHHPDVDRGPLHALRRLGSGELAVLCGAALGAGEHGLGFLCDGVGSMVGAAVAVGIEPGVRPRLVATTGEPSGAQEALLDHLGLVPIADDAPAVLERLRRATATLHG
jgi:nicotinate-nucleotide--dimethylbenzimidazole phosphoribosyltransferase